MFKFASVQAEASVKNDLVHTNHTYLLLIYTSVFNTSDFKPGMGGDRTGWAEQATCQYRGYRNGPDHEDKYGLSPQYWHVFAARLLFVVIFEVSLPVVWNLR